VNLRKRFKALALNMGPGFITGAADDDPSGIATYSQVGAQYGYSLLWTAILQLPLLIATQEAVGRISSCTGKGLALIIREHYGRWTARVLVVILVAANTLNAGADIGAVAGSTRLILHLPIAVLTISTTAIILVLEIFVGYRYYAKILRYLGCALIAYVITMFTISEPWGQIFRASIVPTFHLNPTFMLLIVATFGTTITPFMFFWQGDEDIEEEIAQHIAPPSGTVLKDFLRHGRSDTITGMLFSEVVQWSIIVVCATVLFTHGITTITSASQAALALKPFAGQYNELLFAVGVVGVGLMAIPVMIGSSAYAVAEVSFHREGLYRKLGDAKAFYGVIVVCTLVALGVNFLGLDPVKILIYAAALNGLVSVPLLFFIARLNSASDLLDDNRGGRASRWVVWATFAVMLIAAVCLVVSL
jgi:Mn2+/Fe2+ NRAMP family transporter